MSPDTTTSALGLGSPRPHLRRDWARPSHICTGTGLAAATSAPGLGSLLPHLRQDWAHSCHICTGTRWVIGAVSTDRARPVFVVGTLAVFCAWRRNKYYQRMHASLARRPTEMFLDSPHTADVPMSEVQWDERMKAGSEIDGPGDVHERMELL